MQDQINYLVQKLDKIDAKQDEMAETLAVNTLIVKQHEQRSTQLEERMIPLEGLASAVNTGIKISLTVAGAITGLVGLAAGLKALF